MSITATINNLTFTFELDADECWNIYAEHNFIEYVARDAKFSPLKTSTAAQIQELLKYEGHWEWFVAKNDKGVESRNIMLWWYVPLLDMKIIVQLEKKPTSVAEDVEVRFKMQEKQIAELKAEHKAELAKLRDEHTAAMNKLQSQFDRLALCNKRMVIHFEMKDDKLEISYEDKSPEAVRAYEAYMNVLDYKSLSRANVKHTIKERHKNGNELYSSVRCYDGDGDTVNSLSIFNPLIFGYGHDKADVYIDINYRKYQYKEFESEVYDEYTGKSKYMMDRMQLITDAKPYMWYPGLLEYTCSQQCKPYACGITKRKYPNAPLDSYKFYMGTYLFLMVYESRVMDD